MNDHLSAANRGGVVDVHAHFLPDWYVEQASAAGHPTPDGMPRWPQWSVDEHLALMDRTGVERALLSVSSPGAQFGDERAGVARRLNDDAAELCELHPDRFSFLATLALPDVTTACDELNRAMSDLGAVGACLLTNIDGASIAAEPFAEVWRELDKRSSIVLLHPTSPVFPVAAPFPAPMMEFLFDTARAVAGLAFSGRLDRDAANTQIVIPHVGGVIPVLVDRWLGMAGMSDPDAPSRISRALDRLWFDLAGTPIPVQADILSTRWGTERIVYGSDCCFTPAPLIESQVAALDRVGIADVDDWRQAVAANARALLRGVT